MVDTSIRLTNYVRQKTLDALIVKRFAKEEAALKSEEKAFALKLYKTCFPEYKKVQKLPGWFHTYSHFRVRVNGQQHSYLLMEPMPLPADRRDPNMPDELAAEARAIRQKRELFEQHLDSARSQAKALLWSVSTVKRLLETWPEVKPFLPKELEQPPTALAIPMAQLNSMFGLGAK